MYEWSIMCKISIGCNSDVRVRHRATELLLAACSLNKQLCLAIALTMLVGAIGISASTRAFSENCRFLLDGCDVVATPQPVPASRTPDLVPNTDDRYWLHNRSRMVLYANGTVRKFIYQVPREGLAEAGIKNGSVLFDGEREGDRYTGTAYIFSENCGKLAYEVRGPVSDDDRKVTLNGKRPRVNGSCRTVERVDDTLVFTYQGP
jgi:hypothetical protein